MLASPLATVALLSLSLTWAAPAPTQVKDPAELLPAGTLAYAEVRQPGRFAGEFAGLFEGSVLGDFPHSVAKRLEGSKGQFPRRGFGELGGFGLLLSPEMVKEARRLQGMAVGLTGFKDGQPEWLVVVLPGESNAPAFALRAFLANGEAVPAGEVEGVRLYRVRVVLVGRTITRPKGPPPKLPPGVKPPQGKPGRAAAPALREESGLGPVLAMTPGALFVGSPDAVKDAVHRLTGHGKGATLAGNKTFLQARKEVGSHPGLFAFAEPVQLLTALEKGLAETKDKGIRVEGAEALAAVGKLINFKAFRAVSYSLTLDKGTLRISKLALLDPAEKSPLLELLPSKPVKTTLFQFTPKDAVLAVALSNDNGEERWTRLVKLMDALAKLAGPRAPVPSEEIAKVEKALGVDLGKDVFGKISAAGFALGNLLEAPVRRVEKKGKGFRTVSTSPEIPAVFVLQTADEETAGKLLELVPKVVSLFTGKEVKAVVKDIAGQKVYLLGEESGRCYGRQGSTIVFGPDAKSVAQALANGAKGKGWLSNAKLAGRLEKEEASIFLAAVRPFSLLAGLSVVGWSQSRTFDRVGPDVKPLPPPPKRRQAAPVREEDPLKKEMSKLLAKEGLLIVRVTRQPDRILAEVTLTDLKPMVARLTDFLLIRYFAEAAPAKAPPFDDPKATPVAPPK